jgi:DNA-binding response OmpR family regulator
VKLRALIFDDDAMIRQLLWTVFDQRGYQVFTFPDPGLCPLSSAHHCTCPTSGVCADVIISDLNMPNVKGLDFVEALREKGCTCHAIALMSGSWSEEDESRGRRIGCKLFAKPFTISELNDWLRQIESSVSADRVLTDWRRVSNTEE